MTLDYRILWIDDTPDWVNSVRPGIILIMEEAELKPMIVEEVDGDKLELLIQSNQFDLIIVDYQLGERNGNDLIHAVRACGDLTEIIFYSQENDHHATITQTDGVHCTSRDDAPDHIIRVLKEFSSRCKNIGFMRGIIITEAIDAENLLTKIIKKLFGDKSQLLQDKILDKKRLDFGAKLNLVQSCLKDKIKAAESSTPRGAQLTELRACQLVLNTMLKEVVHQRNILAHSEKRIDASGVLILNGLHDEVSDIVFNNAWKNEIRSNIRKHKDNLQKLYDLM